MSLLNRVLMLALSAQVMLASPSASAAKHNRVLVIAAPKTTRRVALLKVHEDVVNLLGTLLDVHSFATSESGKIIYRDSARNWYKGDVSSSASRIAVPPGIIPAGAEGIALANQGKRLAFVARRGTISRLIIADLRSGSRKTLITHEGYIKAPSWAPGGSRIAYYLAPPTAPRQDGYRLAIAQLDEPHAIQKLISPPSLWTRLSPGRSDPPLWSPDGSMLIFEARYRSQEPVAFNYIVHVDGSGLRAFVRGTWSEDGERLLTLRTSGTAHTGYLHTLAYLNRADSYLALKDLGIDLPRNCINCKWSPDAHYVAFTTADNAAYLLNVRSRKVRTLMPADAFSTLYWVQKARVVGRDQSSQRGSSQSGSGLESGKAEGQVLKPQ